MTMEVRTIPNATILREVSDLLLEGREVKMGVKGSSMLPFIVGERDNVVLTRPEEVSPGDIVLAEIAPGHYVLHRVKSVEEGQVTLKGDGNLDGEEHCLEGDIRGTVIRIETPRRSVDARTPAFMRRSRAWAAAPRWVRRYSLAIIRRLI